MTVDDNVCAETIAKRHFKNRQAYVPYCHIEGREKKRTQINNRQQQNYEIVTRRYLNILYIIKLG